jgi:hypothetical protein
MSYGADGTRRAAVFAGIDPWSNEFMVWAHQQMLDSQALIFRYGVQHLFSPLIVPNNLKEAHYYRDQLFRQIEPALTRPEALAQHRALGIRVRLLGGEQVPEVRATAEKLDALTGANGSQTPLLPLLGRWWKGINGWGWASCAVRISLVICG